jgi:hypothetical protein
MKKRLNDYYKILTITLVFLIGCNRENSFNRRLTNDSSCFWDVYDVKVGYITGSFSFDKNGKCFYYSNKDGKRARLYDDDVVYTHTWLYKKSNILNINGFDRKILRFVGDTLILQNVKTADTIFLIKDGK